ncbi:MAG: hypothetical protein A2817_00375 [Candidatus Yanofskybacteria bacterium RIFCSPHIGHO2_01_FULL_39_8b]|uniref:Uncharacterized protein n=1 Tax=Candidatus Yanofskybacteria bacterium RIFCSPHIGHO2_01_FULL_39_8b TaxID=1802659 RepID=A0A1F8E8E9_9BACT|nr:MAG: hypothetical protein A2817_00375 [Candidatus Yanofskybacteria bacterium RIFCSPHIGHO2_01_FULL_39_8b]
MRNNFEQLLEKVLMPLEIKKPVRTNRISVAIRKMIFAGLKIVKVAGPVLAVFFVIWFVIFNKEGSAIKIQDVSSAKYNNELVAQIARLIVLPDERPFIATIVDYKPLENNPFFKGAKKGDKVLFYEKADKAILYDIELNRIINVSSINDAGIDYKQ